MKETEFDLVVIGSGPAGQKGAITAAKLGKKVAVVDRKEMIGGVCLHGGTIPSKTLREAILYLSGFRERAFYGKDYSVKERIRQEDLASRVNMVLEREIAVIRDQLNRNGVRTFYGSARFVDATTIDVKSSEDSIVLKGQKFLIACGTRPAHDPKIPFDGNQILDVDQMLKLGGFAKEVIVVGGGIIGLEFASMFAALNIRITLIEQKPVILDFVDREIVERLSYHLRNLNVIFRLGEKIVRVDKDEKNRVNALLESGKKIKGDKLLYAVGRQANADLLNLDAVGIPIDARGKITVNENFQTAVGNIYAAGDVIGFPALASTSMEQGRIASSHMYGEPTKRSPEFLPYGIYTIPEISILGKTEQELTEKKIPYEVGVARYDELAKGQIMGAQSGFLKILFDPESLKLWGVHIIGEGASELIHIGQAILSLGATIEYFRDTVFNYPTLAEAYKVAALDGLNKM